MNYTPKEKYANVFDNIAYHTADECCKPFLL